MPIIAMALVVRDGLGMLALIGLFLIMVNRSERDVPRWLRRRGYPPALYLETKEGRERLRQRMRDGALRDPDDEAGPQ